MSLPSNAEILQGVDQDKSNQLMHAFDIERQLLACNMGEIMWAVAMLQASVIASMPMGAQQMWAAERIGDMVQLALPAAIRGAAMPQGAISHERQ